MKNTKRCFVLFSFYDRTGIEAYLEKQAENGWMLDKTSAFGWHFHRTEPKKIHFSVVYFAKASAFDPEPSEAQLAFHDFCEHTGWKLAASNAQMQIFYNEAPNPTPIETDAALEVSAIHASAKKSHLTSYYLLAGVGILQAALFFWRLISDPIGVLASNANLFSGMCWILMLVLSIVEIVGYHTWHKRAKSAAEFDGSFVETKGHRNFQIVILCMMLLAYVPLQTGEYSVRMGEELVSEAGVDGSSFLGKLLFGEKIYAVKGCGTDDLIYLQTDYDLVESDVYCRKDRKAYYEELLQMLQPKTYYLEIIQSDWTNGIVPADEKLVSCVFGNVDELTPNTTVDRGFSRGEGDEMVLVYAYDADGIFAHSVGTLYCQKNQYFWEYQDVLYDIPGECSSMLDRCFSYMFQ